VRFQLRTGPLRVFPEEDLKGMHRFMQLGGYFGGEIPCS
jgi:hypothetical protein